MNNTIKITPLGGGQEIGANSYLLEWKGKNILLDAGMHPMRSGPEQLVSIERVPQNLDALIISHGHFDHMASLPFVAYNRKIDKIITHKTGFRIIKRMLISTSSFMEKHDKVAKYYNYSESYEMENLDILFAKMGRNKYRYLQKFQITSEIEGYFFDAGHVLGSTGIVLTDGDYTFCYSGDINLQEHGIHKGAVLPEIPKLDFLLLESTCALEDDRKSEKDIWDRFFQRINDAVKNKSRVLIPAFALGRTQDVLAVIGHGVEKGTIPESLQIYLTGLGNAITGIYESNRFQLRDIAFSRLNSFFTSLEFRALDSTYKSHLEKDEPAVFIATNGMLNPGTPSAVLAREFVKSSDETIIFSGYQAPTTMGYDLLNSKVGEYFDFQDEKEPIKIQTEKIYNMRLSAHSGYHDLIEICKKLKTKNICLVHGEEESISILKSGIQESLKINSISPQNGQTIILQDGKSRKAKLLSKIPASIVTVGTSALGSFRRADKKSNPTPSELCKFLEKHELSQNSQSAEIQTLRNMEIEKAEYFYFLASDNDDGFLCAEALQQFYQRKGYFSSVVQIKGLCTEFDKFRHVGLPNLINEIIKIVESHGKNVKIAATGGFKAETAFANLLGSMVRVPVFYIHEDFSNVIEMPVFPMTPDYHLYQTYSNQIETVLSHADISSAEKYIQRLLPMGMEFLFEPNDEKNQMVLSPIGRIFRSLFLEQLNVLKSKSMIEGSLTMKNLWEIGPIQIDLIPNRDVRLLFYRILEFGFLVRKIEFGKMLKNYTKQVYMKFHHSELDRLIYRLHTPFGEQEIFVVSYEGLVNKLIEKLGTKIYP